MSKKYVLGIDGGTGGLRVGLYDLDGNEYHCNGWSSSTSYFDEEANQVYSDWGYETYYLNDFHETEAKFTVNYTHFWVPEEPVVVELTAK